jgi:hypothetical protein
MTHLPQVAMEEQGVLALAQAVVEVVVVQEVKVE